MAMENSTPSNANPSRGQDLDEPVHDSQSNDFGDINRMPANRQSFQDKYIDIENQPTANIHGTIYDGNHDTAHPIETIQIDRDFNALTEELGPELRQTCNPESAEEWASTEKTTSTFNRYQRLLVGLLLLCMVGLAIGLSVVLFQQKKQGVVKISDDPTVPQMPIEENRAPSGDKTSTPTFSFSSDDIALAPTVSPPVPINTPIPTIFQSSKLTPSPTRVVSIRYKQIKSRVVGISGAESLEQTADTPQLKALGWLVDKDPSQINPFDENLPVRYALTVLYFSMQGDGWKTNTNWIVAPDCCNWIGVTCEAVNDMGIERQAITELDLSENNLVGSIPKEIFGTLKFLKDLSLHTNSISGALPENIGLRESIQTLKLYDNNISGTIPASIGNMKGLVKVYMDENKLSGTIPPQIGNLALLEDLHLYNNSLVGDLPTELGLLSNVWRLWLSGNKIGGEIPPEIGNMQSLNALYLEDNNMYGTIPAALSNAIMLKDLRLDQNSFYGEIPNEFGNLKNLNILYLQNNFFVSPVPSWFGSSTRLQYINLSKNQFAGNLPSKISNLKLLDLSENSFEGNIPNEWENQNDLQALFLQGNRLSGSIPNGLQNLPNLKELHLYGNNFNVEKGLCSWNIPNFLVECNIGCGCCNSICVHSDTIANGRGG